MRLLVTDADSPKALAIVRSIGSDYQVWTASDSRFALAAWSRYAHRHRTYNSNSPETFAEWVLSTCRKNQIEVVITPEEDSSFLVAREAAEFKRDGIRIGTLPLEALQIAMDKALTVKSAIEIGVPVPETRILKDITAALPAARELGYPVVVKPRFSRYWTGRQFVASDGVGYANSDQQLLETIRGLDPRLPPPLLQRFIPGKGHGLCFLMAADGTLCAEFAHERLRDYRPTGSGSVLRRSIRVDTQLRETSMRLLRHIGATGVAMVEFRTDNRTNEPYLMEINGRFWGSLQLAIDAGVNFPRLLVDLLLGKPVRTPNYQENIILRWWIGDLVRTFRVLKGRPDGYIGVFPSRLSALRDFLGPQPAGTRNEILRWNDYGPCFVEAISMMRRVFR